MEIGLESFLDSLNEVQQQAVTHAEGPLMIVAGAGSGKTRVLTYRIAHLMKEHDVDPFRILSLTFTNKAAREMRHRIEKLVGPEAKNLWMGTFHSVFARILRSEANKLGYPRDFTIYDTDDSKSLIRTLLKEENLDPKLYKPNYVLNRISLSKNNFISVRQYLDDPETRAQDSASGRPKLGYLYQAYTQRCFKSGAMDFDDILLKTYQLFMEHPDSLNKYQQKFQHVLVDEYQDTNHIQYLIIKKLAAVNRNICVVGDDAQSIYGFRGANIQNILNFEKDYPDLKVYKLEQNYRSTQTIVEAADSIINKNRDQIRKKIWTSNPLGNKIKITKVMNESEEGKMVAQTIFDERMNSQRKNSDFAILYRTNAQSRAFEEWFRKFRIPYRIIGGLSFYQRKEVKDLLAYFRLALNPHDEEAFKRVINYPKRGIGKTSLDNMIIASKETGLSLYEVAEHIDELKFDTRSGKPIREFQTMIKSFMVRVDSTPAYELALAIARESGMLSLLGQDKEPEGIARYQNVQELLSAIQEFSEREPEGVEPEEPTLSLFMQEVALITDADLKDDDQEKVTLMTVHSAKGLEFPVVFGVGMEENLFPSQLSLQSREDLEEERRLFYVALTRAEQRVYLSYAASRFLWGTTVPSEPSRFIDELDPRFVDYQVKTEAARREVQWGQSRNQQAAPQQKFTQRTILKPQKPVSKPLQAIKDFVADDPRTIQTGMEVEHNRFGKGKVLQIDGTSFDNKKATIFFHDHGNKQILLKFAKIRIVR